MKSLFDDLIKELNRALEEEVAPIECYIASPELNFVGIRLRKKKFLDPKTLHLDKEAIYFLQNFFSERGLELMFAHNSLITKGFFVINEEE